MGIFWSSIFSAWEFLPYFLLYATYRFYRTNYRWPLPSPQQDAP